MKPQGICQARGCQNPTSQRSTNRFSKYCSNLCANEHVLAARKKTWLEKYGTDNPSRSATIRRKISKGVQAYNKSIGREPVRRRSFKFQPPTETSSTGSDFYVYLLLDPRKPGEYKYGKWKFEHEPFYVGKGTGDRAYSHVRGCDIRDKVDRNTSKQNKIKKIMRETGKNPLVLIKRKNISEVEAFTLEAKLIWSIGRNDQKLGPLSNHSDGGEGISGRKWTKGQREAQSLRVSSYIAALTAAQRKEIYGRVGQSGKPRSDTVGTVEYQKKLDTLYGKRIKSLSITLMNCTKSLHKCKCGHTWEVSPAYLLKRQLGCPECRKKDPVVQATIRFNKSKARKRAESQMSSIAKKRRSQNLSNSITKAWSKGGALYERRL